MPIVAIVRANALAKDLREAMARIMDHIRDPEGRLLKLATERLDPDNDECLRTGYDGNQAPDKQSGCGTGVRPELTASN